MLGSLSCAATTGMTPSANSMPAARAGLPPDERFFYDALADYGDWVLIEPWGWVFQPHVNWVAWRPYQNGFWAPSDIYGWTWISTEPFGWATFHYGEWLYDNFQGWVWVPGHDWGPAWVSWQAGNGFVGWAPDMPNGAQWNAIPGGPYLYTPTSQLASTDLPQHILKQEQMAGRAQQMKPVENLMVRGGVKFNRGPAFEAIERETGTPLPRVKLEDRELGLPVTAGHTAAKPQHGPRPGPADSLAALRHAAEDVARQARDLSSTKSRVPDKVSVVRPRRPAPDDHPREAGDASKPRPEPAAPASADSSH